MRGKIVFTLLIIMTGWQAAMAQSVTGKVVDKGGTPLEFANVVLTEDSSYVTGVITKADGTFEIARAHDKGSHVEISMIGYESRSLPVPETGNMGTITLEETQVTLKEAVVKAYRPAFKLEGGSLVTNVENTTLAKMGTAVDVLSRLPLVKEEDGEFTVFGKGTPLIYINGRLVRNQNDLRQLSSEAIRSVEVITNPGARYSAEAQAVIRVKTIPQQGDGFSMDLYNDTRASHFAQNTSDFSFNYRHNGLDIFADAYLEFGKRYYRDESGMDTYGENTLLQSISARSA